MLMNKFWRRPVPTLWKAVVTTVFASVLGGCGDGGVPMEMGAVAVPTVSLSASATSVASGGTTTLTWSSINATTCTASGAWSGSKPTSGSEVVSDLTTSGVFTLICADSRGTSRSAAVTVTVIGGGVVLFDDFEYDVVRSATDAERAFQARGWVDAKAINSHFGRGNGYLYTRFDLIRNSRVLVMESYPSTAYNPPNFPYRQTDYWIKYGAEDAPLNTVPANVWFQFWTYATPESRWHSQKFLYPCRGPYPCSTGRFLWLVGYNRQNLTGIGDGAIEAPPGGRFLHFFGDHANNFGGNPWNRQKLFQNVNQTPLLPGVWYQIRIHVDTSGPQGIYEAWIRQREATTWTKVSEWIGGVTPNFDWPIPADMRDGNRVFAMPTTVNEVDSILYLDDFAMATDEAVLPTSP